jgi:hypothetical protein
MVTRAVSARRDWLAPLGVLIPLGATPPLVFWVLSKDPVTVGPVLACLVLAGGLAAAAVGGRVNNGALVAIYTALLTWAVALLATPIWYGIDISTSACDKTVSANWEWLAPTGGVLVFLAVGSWGIRTHRNLTVVPLAGLFGVLVFLVLFAAAPGTTGVCET